MGYQANVLKVMIASPGDVAGERKIVTEEIYRWNDAHAETRKIILQPINWETHSTPRLGKAPQDELNDQIAQGADILIGIFGARIGTPTERYVSGTVEEIRNHLAMHKTTKVYFSDVPVQPSSIDPEQYKLLQSFKEECKPLGLYATYENILSFQREFKQHLDIELNASRYQELAMHKVAPDQAPAQVSNDAMLLLSKAEQAGGLIQTQLTMEGDSVRTGSEQFTDGTKRSSARWREAVQQLGEFDYVEEKQHGSGLFNVTHLGYLAIDKAEASKPTNISAQTSGTPGQQQLEIKASKPIKLSSIDYLHSTDACIVSQPVMEVAGKSIMTKFDYKKVVELNNSARPDKNPYDGSGPAKLRLIFDVNGKHLQMLLPVQLKPEFVANTQWITLTGLVETTL